MRVANEQTKEALRLSEQRFSKAFNESPVALVITRLSDGMYINVNTTFLKMFEYNSNEIIGHKSSEVNIFDNLETQKVFFELFSKKKVNNLQMSFKSKTGRLIPTMISIEKLEINGQDHLLTTLVDVTERKKMEDELAFADKEWAITFDAIPDMIAILDKDHKIKRVNKAMADRLGVTPKQCIGLQCFECVHGAKQPPEFCPHMKTLKDGKQHIEQVYEERLGGNLVVSTTPLRDAQGKVIGSVHIARVLTK